MSENKLRLLHDHNHDGVDRRGFLKCMACELRPRATCIGGGRFDARLSGKQPDSGNQVDQR